MWGLVIPLTITFKVKYQGLLVHVPLLAPIGFGITGNVWNPTNDIGAKVIGSVPVGRSCWGEDPCYNLLVIGRNGPIEEV